MGNISYITDIALTVTDPDGSIHISNYEKLTLNNGYIELKDHNDKKAYVAKKWFTKFIDFKNNIYQLEFDNKDTGVRCRLDIDNSRSLDNYMICKLKEYCSVKT